MTFVHVTLMTLGSSANQQNQEIRSRYNNKMYSLFLVSGKNDLFSASQSFSKYTKIYRCSMFNVLFDVYDFYLSNALRVLLCLSIEDDLL